LAISVLNSGDKVDKMVRKLFLLLCSTKLNTLRLI